ncbi:hypothetical protein QQF64_019536, partial [Cirrhinus molitorella]
MVCLVFIQTQCQCWREIQSLCTLSSDSEKIFNVSVTDVPAAELYEMKEGEAVTLDAGLMKQPNDVMAWYFNDTLIAEITEDQSKICTDNHCSKRFRDRLQLNHQTGSLTITNIRITDSGEYKLKISSSSSKFSFNRVKSFSVSITAVPDSGLPAAAVAGIVVGALLLVASVAVGVVYCHRMNRRTKLELEQECGYLKQSTAFLCLIYHYHWKLKRQTITLLLQSAVIQQIQRSALSKLGELKKRIFGSSDSEIIFSVTVIGVPVAEEDEIKRKSVKDGESVTLDPGVIKGPNDEMTWFFNYTLIAEITGGQSKTCTNDQCAQRFRDRLKLDHQTGSLTITNTRTTDSGLYKLQIQSSKSSFSLRRIKSFSFTVTGSGLYPGKIAGICAAVIVVLLVTLTVGVLCCRRHRSHTPVSHNV